jgi:hypothetical protein
VPSQKLESELVSIRASSEAENAIGREFECHARVMRIVMNGAEWQTKTEKRRYI